MQQQQIEQQKQLQHLELLLQQQQYSRSKPDGLDAMVQLQLLHQSQLQQHKAQLLKHYNSQNQAERRDS